MASKLIHFKRRLDKLKKANPDPDPNDPYGRGRHSYCTLVYMSKQVGIHFFEVRGYRLTKNGTMLDISSCNWTLSAGTCTIELTEENLNEWNILEDSPCLRVLYGRN